MSEPCKTCGQKPDGEIGWKYLKRIMDALPVQFQSPDLYNTAQKVEEYIAARPLERRTASKERRAPPFDPEAFNDLLGSLSAGSVPLSF